MWQHNVCLGWIWITLGFVSGALIGMFFYDTHWLGGYNSWRRRMVRLGHISFVGTGLLNLAFAFTLAMREGPSPPQIVSWLFLVGAMSMPTVCFLAAWRDEFRFLFAIPVTSLIGASTLLIIYGL